MNLTVNGEKFEYSGKRNITALLHDYDANPERVAVMLNDDIIARDLWETTEIKENNRIEILSFAGGG